MKIATRMLKFLGVAGAFFSIGMGTAAASASYPLDRPVNIVVGFSAGGSTDMLARLLAKAFAEDLKGNFIVENKPGANSNIAMSHVARAKPDGHTLLMVPFGFPINQYLYQSVPYDFEKDFAPVALVAKVPNAIVVRADSSIKTVKDYVESSSKSQQGITFSTPGVGSSLHLAGELFKYETKANLLHVPFKGSAPSLMAVMSGDSDSAFENLSTAAQHIEAGKLRAIAVTSRERSSSFPDVPTVAESGYPQFQINSYFGLAAPAGTPKPIVDELNQAVMRALNRPEIRDYLKNLGAITEKNSPEDFTRFLKSEGERWKPVIEAAGIEKS